MTATFDHEGTVMNIKDTHHTAGEKLPQGATVLTWMLGQS